MDDAAFFHAMREEVGEKTLPIEIGYIDGVWIFIPQGRIDLDASSDLDAALAEGIKQGMRRIVIDFSLVTYISSSGLRVIIKTAKILKTNKGAFAITDLNGVVRQVFEVSGILKILAYYDTIDAAVAAIR
jgi:anti-sigma B factor antagonist